LKSRADLFEGLDHLVAEASIAPGAGVGLGTEGDPHGVGLLDAVDDEVGLEASVALVREMDVGNAEDVCVRVDDAHPEGVAEEQLLGSLGRCMAPLVVRAEPLRKLECHGEIDLGGGGR
jgi:hypothetical protein